MSRMATAGIRLLISTSVLLLPRPNSTLAGSGEVGSLAARGVVSPGALGVPGILRVAGSATLSNTAAFVVSVNGPAPGADYDQLRVGGTVRLENAALQLTQGAFTPSPGASSTG